MNLFFLVSLASGRLCFEFQSSNRNREPKFRALMSFIRDPPKTIPDDVQMYWKSIQMQETDVRLRDERFQIGHMLAIYWSTLSRWMMMRARRDAVSLRTPLILVQAADSPKPSMPLEMDKIDECAKP